MSPTSASYVASQPSVRNAPGATQLTRTVGPHSNASVRLDSTTPARAAAVWAMPGNPRPTMATICTMLPPPPSSIWLPNTCVIVQVPFRFRSITLRQPLGLKSRAFLRELTPGIVDEDVDPMTGGERLDGLAVADVDHVDVDGVAGRRRDLGGGGVEALPVAGGDHHVGTGR